MWKGIVSITVGVLRVIIITSSKKEIGKGDYEGSFNLNTSGYTYAVILISIGVYTILSSI